MKFGTFRKAAGVAAAALVTVAAAAQTGNQQAAGGQPGAAQPAPSGGGLNIPSDFTFVGNSGANNVARATAIVNSEIITRTDIEQRLALLLAAQPNVKVPEQEMQQLRAQVLRNLIDEALQIQAATEKEIKIEPREIDRYFGRYAQSLGQTVQTFPEFLKSIGSSERSIKRQILGELSWQQLQRRLIRASVSDEEVQNILDRLNASRGSSEYRVAEIYVPATAETAADVRGRMGQIVQQVRSGASFTAYARQFSQASTAARGGDLGWVRMEQIPAEIGAVVQQMPVGAISDPIQVPGGFSVVALVDSRQVLVANPRDAVLSLMQMSITMPPGTTEAVAQQRAQELARATQSMGGCGAAAQTAQALGAELVSNDSTRVRELPPQLEPMLLSLNVGQATQPFGTVERVSVLILCGRDDPKAAPAPTFASIADALEEQRMGRQAQRYLRDLRRDAVIEYR